MAREHSLLERVARAEAAGARTGPAAGEDIDRLLASVQGNLTRLLNARHGMCAAVPDYGLPALSDLRAGRDINLRALEDAIRVCIEKYEPRLRRVRVSLRSDAGDVNTPVFRIEAILVGRGGEHGVWYETAVDPVGKLRVSG